MEKQNCVCPVECDVRYLDARTNRPAIWNEVVEMRLNRTGRGEESEEVEGEMARGTRAHGRLAVGLDWKKRARGALG